MSVSSMLERPFASVPHLTSHTRKEHAMLQNGSAHGWCPMFRLLGFLFVVIIGIATAPWGLVIGAVAFAGWLLTNQEPLSKIDGLRSSNEGCSNGASCLNAVPLLKAVYCANCDLITDSPHDACEVCGSHSVIGVSRMWQLAPGGPPAKTARFKVSFAANIRNIPVTGLNESMKLINRLAELGGHVVDLHIQVDPVFSANIEVLKPVEKVRDIAWDRTRRAS